jgi:hypothetical protein
MTRLKKPVLFLVVGLGAVGLVVAGFWVVKTLYDQPIDSYAVSYHVEGLTGSEDIQYRTSTTGYPADVTMRTTRPTGPTWSDQDAVIGANDEARLVITGSTSDRIRCTIIRDEGHEFEKTLSVTVTRDGGGTICVARPR